MPTSKTPHNCNDSSPKHIPSAWPSNATRRSFTKPVDFHAARRCGRYTRSTGCSTTVRSWSHPGNPTPWLGLTLSPLPVKTHQLSISCMGNRSPCFWGMPQGVEQLCCCAWEGMYSNHETPGGNWLSGLQLSNGCPYSIHFYFVQLPQNTVLDYYTNYTMTCYTRLYCTKSYNTIYIYLFVHTNSYIHQIYRVNI